MTPKSAIRAEAARLQALIGAGGAEPVEADILQPAATLLDLYGEDIRARAYVTADPVRGEQMLRPDFTVPVVQMHMARGAKAARYTYAGEVFRRQEDPADGRPAEFIQVGLELFDGRDPAAHDAEVFATLASALAPLGLNAAMGDIGLLTASISGLTLSEPRRAALMRHIWRPHRFRALLDRFGGQRPVSASRAALLDQLAHKSADALVSEAGPVIGLRSADEIARRIEALAADAAEPPLPARERALIDDLLAIRAAPRDALAKIRDIAVDMPTLLPAADRLSDRLEALARRGVDLDAIVFETAYGRTTLEYYDGFVFGLVAPQHPAFPPVASGGRYDALTAKLGGGQAVPAVGGVIRPGVVLDLESRR
ncbi:MAG: ATP phosphoribosyltransferase regulatory subunit [Pseudomonadota bacterium]